MQDLAKFRVCPENLPDVPDVQLLCEDGCYLFHPDTERAARFDALRAREVDRIADEFHLTVGILESTILSTRAQRDQERFAVSVARDLLAQKNGELFELRSELASSFSLIEVGLYVGAAIIAGVAIKEFSDRVD